MAEPVQYKKTKAEREAAKLERIAKQEKENQAKVAQLPDSIHGMPIVEVSYTGVGKKEVKALRKEFTPQRKAFLKELAETQKEALLAAGISESAIQRMAKNGESPSGYNVHHKIPLAGGGKNSFSNFILIKNEPYHTDIHKVSDLQIKHINQGETKTVKMPMPQGSVFVPPAQEKQKTHDGIKSQVSQVVLKKTHQGR